MQSRLFAGLLTALVGSTACATVQSVIHPHAVRPDQVSDITLDVRNIVTRFTNAVAKLDAPAALELVAGDSAFEVVLDGEVTSGQAAFAELVRTTFPTLKPGQPNVDSVRVAVLTPASAIARVVYRQLNAGGAEDHGIITYALVRGKQGWRIVYQHVTTLR